MNTKTSYAEKLRDPRWLKKRVCVLQRDAFTCRDCGATDKPLQVHHCLYESGNPWETSERFLLTLCADCHEHRGPLEKDGKRALQIIFSKLGCGPDDEQLSEFVTALVHMADSDHPDPHLMRVEEAVDLWEKANGR